MQRHEVNVGYRYIKDKVLYRATKLAYSYMVKSNDFETAVKHYADVFGVDCEELAKEVKKMQKIKCNKKGLTKYDT
jgi:hypothetical protein